MFPYLNELQTSRDMIDVFYGYNANERIKENEFADMLNMSSDKYPMLAQRKPRGLYREGMTAPTGMIAKDNIICYVDGDQFIVMYPEDLDTNKRTVILNDFLESTNEPKQLVSMGAYVIILPDKKFVNTADPTKDNGEIEFTQTFGEGQVRISLCQEDGTEYKNDESIDFTDGDITVDVKNNMPVGVKAPSEPSDGVYWIDTTVEESPMLKRWSSTAESWVPITTTYVKIKAKDISVGFKEGDGVTFSGIAEDNLNGISTLVTVYRDTYSEEVGTGDYVVIKGMCPYISIECGNITISRTMPDVDFICESGNRLWGCKYGYVDGKFLNEIYASKLGDFRNWNCFDGISTDSYAVSCGTDGPFTAAVSYGGHPIFFKENCMHMIYGSYPAEYQTVNNVCRGVQQGCERSLAVVNEVLYYKSRAGIMYYDGSLPASLTDVFGGNLYDNAVACGFRNKYYISMRNAKSGEYGFFAYDASKGLWHKEDNLHALWMCANRDDVYYVDASNQGQLRTLFATNRNYLPAENKLKWQVVSGLLGLSYPDAKYISRITIRAKLEYGASFKVFIRYDNEQLWRPVYTTQYLRKDIDGEPNRGTVAIPIRTCRCDHFRLKFEGEGNVDIISISKTIEQGSDFRGGL